MKETLEQAVSRITERTSKALFPKYCAHFNGAYCDVCGPKDIGAALREMAEWVYRDAAVLVKHYEDPVQCLGRAAAAIRKGE